MKKEENIARLKKIIIFAYYILFFMIEFKSNEKKKTHIIRYYCTKRNTYLKYYARLLR